jgi:hypothetical protein
MTSTTEGTPQPQEKRNAAAPKPVAKAKPARKLAAKPEASNAALAAGALLLDLVKRAKTNVAGDVGDLAKRLANDRRLTRKDLVALRDEIKALAAVLREQKKDALAAKFARANRAVRRLERAARKGGRS